MNPVKPAPAVAMRRGLMAALVHPRDRRAAALGLLRGAGACRHPSTRPAPATP